MMMVIIPVEKTELFIMEEAVEAPILAQEEQKKLVPSSTMAEAQGWRKGYRVMVIITVEKAGPGILMAIPLLSQVAMVETRDEIFIIPPIKKKTWSSPCSPGRTSISTAVQGALLAVVSLMSVVWL